MLLRWVSIKRTYLDNAKNPQQAYLLFPFILTGEMFPFFSCLLPGNTSAVEEEEGSSEEPEIVPPAAVPSYELPPVLAEIKIFLDKHRPQKPEITENTCPPRRLDSGLGLKYKGQLRQPDDLPHGWGRVTLPDGVVYEGQWSGGRIHGQGALQLPNGNAYWGSWALGRKDGLGTFMWADGSRHDGYYKAGWRSGVGTLKYASGAVFEGQFQNDQRHGVGRLELLDGSSYDGEWVKDVPHGLGVFVDAGSGGERFEGSWERGLRSGGGRLVQGWVGTREDDGGSLAGTAWYSGSFKDGLPHGEGAMGYGSATFCGHVERGVWTGGGRIDLGGENGSFEGTFSDGLPSGSGRWRWEGSGVEMDCSFEEGYSRKIWPS